MGTRVSCRPHLSSDPLQQVLIAVGLYQEEFGTLADPYPGCLLASYIYELQLFDKEVEKTINDTFLAWREALVERFERIEKIYPPSIEVDLPSLADEFVVIIEGAFILAKSMHEPKVVIDQLQPGPGSVAADPGSVLPYRRVQGCISIVQIWCQIHSFRTNIINML